MSEHETTTHERGRMRRYTVMMVQTLLAGGALVFVTMLAWNMFAPDLFDAESMRMKQALGIVLLGVVISALLRIGRRGGHRNMHGSHH